MKTLKLGIAGLGQRGSGMLNTFMLIDGVEVVAFCDLDKKRVDRAIDKVKQKQGSEPKGYSDFEEMLKDGEINAVYIASSWDEHIGMSIKSLCAGKITAMEVGGAYDVEECWDLVRAYEETKTPFMFLENCCYDKFELLCTTLARRGAFGEIVYCHGAYSHDLRDEVLGGVVNGHYRLDNYKKRNCENYPTHELGPIARILNINRGNKLMYLSSFSSKACGLKAFTTDKRNPDPNQIGENFAQGDIVTTTIKCANGETITLTLDTTLPKYYSREFSVRGTKGLANQEANMVMIEDDCDFHSSWVAHEMVQKQFNSAEKYEVFLPDIWTKITDEERAAGHGGMDYLMLKEFVRCALNGEKMPIDVYDAATWMCISALSEQSVAMGSLPVPVPDFTKGKWIKRKSEDVTPLKTE